MYIYLSNIIYNIHRLKEAIKSHVSVDGGEMKLHYQLSNGSMTDNAMAKQMKGKGDLVTTLMDGRSCMQEVLPGTKRGGYIYNGNELLFLLHHNFFPKCSFLKIEIF